ncbi:hypothetical protein GW17_00007073 [Ensete ventricosum]|nr:hypothetical protein GW17_00007073 [Ensete ventricosum]
MSGIHGSGRSRLLARKVVMYGERSIKAYILLVFFRSRNMERSWKMFPMEVTKTSATTKSQDPTMLTSLEMQTPEVQSFGPQTIAIANETFMAGVLATSPVTGMGSSGATVQVSNIPLAAVAGEFFEYFEAAVGSVFACEIFTARRNWKSRGFGRVQFDSLAAAERACLLAAEGRLPNFQTARLTITRSRDDIVARAAEGRNRVEGAVLRAGVLVGENRMEVFGVWEGVRAEIMPEKKKLELLVDQSGEKYKLEVMFGDIIASCSCCLDGSESNAILLQV